MPIKHSSMRQSKPQEKKQPAKSYVVDDATNTGDYVDQEKQPDPIQPKPSRPSRTIDDERRSLLEDLLFLGRTEKIVDIDGMSFEISTLTQKETSDMMKILYSSGDAGDLFTIQALTLSFAIKSVNNVALEDLPTEVEYSDALDKKIDILNSMQKRTIEKLHESYVELRDGAEEVVDDEEAREDLKNS